ncbi:CPBP family intramembrane metalloprotease [filamentous cyanobacterium CCP5]|nr:CPBP family intramembrane metalloprotease [filamentous cyanobacterium CCP5]
MRPEATVAEHQSRSLKVRLWGLLWLLGIPGVLSLLSLPLPGDVPVSTAVVKGLMLVQPTILLSVAVLLGVQLAHRVGLAAPVAAAWVQGRSPRKAIAPQLLPGIIGGLLSGIALQVIVALSQGWLPAAYRSAEPTPAIVRFLYGGITEELLMRWGLMTLLLWLGWRFGQGRRGQPAVGWVVVAIALSAGLFAVAHLPYLVALGLPLTPLLVSYILLQNSLFAVVAGYLYWRYGLEAAIVAHLVVHAVLLIGT